MLKDKTLTYISLFSCAGVGCFGFKKAGDFGIKAPFEVPEENFMAIELNEEALKNISGVVRYANEFLADNNK